MMTPRIRTVKPELHTHLGLFGIEMKYKIALRIAYVALFSCCDREGRFCWQPKRLHLHILPYDDVDIEEVLDIFLRHKYIRKYEYLGELYGCIPSWPFHQRITKEAPSTLPPIEIGKELFSNFNVDNEIAAESVSTIARLAPSETHENHLFTSLGSEMNSDMESDMGSDVKSDRETDRVVGKEGKGREEEEKEGKGSIVAQKARPRVDEPIQNIFEHWKRVMGHPMAMLDDKRRSTIGKALKFGYSTADLCAAITGCSLTPHNIGDNDRGQRYDGLHVILRDADQIDRFIRNYNQPPRRLNEAERRSQVTTQALDEWVQKTLVEETAHASA